MFDAFVETFVLEHPRFVTFLVAVQHVWAVAVEHVLLTFLFVALFEVEDLLHQSRSVVRDIEEVVVHHVLVRVRHHQQLSLKIGELVHETRVVEDRVQVQVNASVLHQLQPITIGLLNIVSELGVVGGIEEQLHREIDS
jgi:hypothetical protein